MLRRFSFAVTFAILGLLASTGISEAAKGPDARDVSLVTLLVIVCSLTFLTLMFMLRVALGGARTPPPEDPGAGAHH
jgi:hypothetical protein